MLSPLTPACLDSSEARTCDPFRPGNRQSRIVTGALPPVRSGAAVEPLLVLNCGTTFLAIRLTPSTERPSGLLQETQGSANRTREVYANDGPNRANGVAAPWKTGLTRYRAGDAPLPRSGLTLYPNEQTFSSSSQSVRPRRNHDPP